MNRCIRAETLYRVRFLLCVDVVYSDRYEQSARDNEARNTARLVVGPIVAVRAVNVVVAIDLISRFEHGV